ncbi:uncharacterized protein CBO05P1_195 [Clostridium botulinum B str. Osaka05]|uniref:Uncharacterized protein n=1 Tax=Clostridium botulinum B str. Osaka05 TaxID=1407017 RepID=A0A060N9J9_CLOBO|nr:hypothetical protein [Clostridium botulinum]BAO04914.1 uncharacterized protein CBO05P1_195 [Clostridium botulinum B str. Osaka05]
MYSDNIRHCEETIFKIKDSNKLYNMINKANYSDSFRKVLRNISKEEILELLEEYDALHICNFEQFYKNKYKKGKLYE